MLCFLYLLVANTCTNSITVSTFLTSQEFQQDKLSFENSHVVTVAVQYRPFIVYSIVYHRGVKRFLECTIAAVVFSQCTIANSGGSKHIGGAGAVDSIAYFFLLMYMVYSTIVCC
jgi:hypothetical protein